MMTRLVFASSNEHKTSEIRNMLPEGYQLVNLADVGCDEDIPETADTIEGNALLKARYVYNKYGLDCFADDSGLEVEALDGAPGVYSARYGGPARNDSDNIDKLLKELAGKPNRSAQFKTVIALIADGKETLFTGLVRGSIIEERRGSFGFGYDPVFIPDGHSITFAEMQQHEKAAISHRGLAVKQLIGNLVRQDI